MHIPAGWKLLKRSKQRAEDSDEEENRRARRGRPRKTRLAKVLRQEASLRSAIEEDQQIAEAGPRGDYGLRHVCGAAHVY